LEKKKRDVGLLRSLRAGPNHLLQIGERVIAVKIFASGNRRLASRDYVVLGSPLNITQGRSRGDPRGNALAWGSAIPWSGGIWILVMAGAGYCSGDGSLREGGRFKKNIND